MDPYRLLGISPNPDGTLTRHPSPLLPISPASSVASDATCLTVSKDVLLNPQKGTWIRIFRPAAALPPSTKLPVVIHFHGGGFILFSAATDFVNNYTERISASVPAVVLAVEYRLAPEHRLPAAYDDAVEAVLWARDQASSVSAADTWLSESADFRRCYLMGDSAGGNIAYNAWLRLAAAGLETLEPLKLQGVILNQPFFGGESPTESEVRLSDDKALPSAAAELMWRLSLPVGVSKDHEWCNPAASPPPPPEIRCMVRGYLGDPVIDRQRELAMKMKEAGVEVVALVEMEGYHGVELMVAEKLELLLSQAKEFINYPQNPQPN